MDDILFNKYLNELTKDISILPDKQEETPENTLKALWLKSAGIPVSALKAETCELPDLTKEMLLNLDKMVANRIKGVPLAHLTGRQSFMGMEMLAGPEALIPRKETEILGYTAIKIVKDITNKNLCVIDVCTGAGNIALAIAKSSNSANIYASDLSEDAVKLAKKNCEFLQLTSQVKFYSGDLLEPFEKLNLFGKVDLLTCNPPYISSSKVSEMPDEISSHEPGLAFDGGAFGVNLIRKLITEAEKYLSKDGYLCVEVGLGQGQVIKKQVEKSAIYKNIQTVNDDSGNPRVVVAQKI